MSAKRLDERGSILGRGTSKLALGHTQPLIHWGTGGKVTGE